MQLVRNMGGLVLTVERREKHLFLYQGQLLRLISQFAMTEPYLL